MQPPYWIRATICASTLLAASVAAQGQVRPDAAALTLERAEALLTERNRDIVLARRALEQAQADVTVAGQRPNPQLGWVTQNINRGRGIGAGNLRDKTVDSIISLSQTFERGSKAELRVATAKQLESAAGADLNDMARVQMLSLRTAYFDLLAAQERLLTLRESAALFEQTLNAAQLRQKAGDLAGADVARIGVDAARAVNDARAAEGDLSRARLGVASLIAMETEAPQLRAVSPWPTVIPSMGSMALEEAAAQRPDVRAALARLSAAEQARELAQALRTRDVTLSVQFEHFPVSEANQTGSGNSVGFGVSVPLFLRHHYEGEVARAQADWYAARDFVERVKAQSLAELMKARGDLEAAAERSRRIESDLLPRAIRSSQAAEFAFRNGALGVMDLLDSRRTLKSIQLEATAARADLAKALAAWQAGLTATNGMETAVDAARDGRK